MTYALLMPTEVLLAGAAVMLIVVLLLSWVPGRGWRFHARDVAQPSPNKDGDGLRVHPDVPDDPLTPRLERETPEREIRY